MKTHTEQAREVYDWLRNWNHQRGHTEFRDNVYRLKSAIARLVSAADGERILTIANRTVNGWWSVVHDSDADHDAVREAVRADAIALLRERYPELEPQAVS